LNQQRIRNKLARNIDNTYFQEELRYILMYAMDIAMASLEGRDVYYDGTGFFTKPGCCEQPADTVHILFIAGGGAASLSNGQLFSFNRGDTYWGAFVDAHIEQIIQDAANQCVCPTKVSLEEIDEWRND
jgi:hypothetical protein